MVVVVRFVLVDLFRIGVWLVSLMVSCWVKGLLCIVVFGMVISCGVIIFWVENVLLWDWIV